MTYFIRVDATTDAVHELIVEPVQEPRAREQQEDAVEHAPEDFVNAVEHAPEVFVHLCSKS